MKLFTRVAFVLGTSVAGLSLMIPAASATTMEPPTNSSDGTNQSNHNHNTQTARAKAGSFQGLNLNIPIAGLGHGDTQQGGQTFRAHNTALAGNVNGTKQSNTASDEPSKGSSWSKDGKGQNGNGDDGVHQKNRNGNDQSAKAKGGSFQGLNINAPIAVLNGGGSMVPITQLQPTPASEASTEQGGQTFQAHNTALAGNVNGTNQSNTADGDDPETHPVKSRPNDGKDGKGQNGGRHDDGTEQSNRNGNDQSARAKAGSFQGLNINAPIAVLNGGDTHQGGQNFSAHNTAAAGNVNGTKQSNTASDEPTKGDSWTKDGKGQHSNGDDGVEQSNRNSNDQSAKAKAGAIQGGNVNLPIALLNGHGGDVRALQTTPSSNGSTEQGGQKFTADNTAAAGNVNGTKQSNTASDEPTKGDSWTKDGKGQRSNDDDGVEQSNRNSNEQSAKAKAGSFQGLNLNAPIAIGNSGDTHQGGQNIAAHNTALAGNANGTSQSNSN